MEKYHVTGIPVYIDPDHPKKYFVDTESLLADMLKKEENE